MSADRRIDWDRVRAQLAERLRALEEAATVGPERLEAVYRERAAALAARRAAAAGPAAGLRVLAVGVGGERYGLDFRDVAELLPFAGCTPVPGGPPELLGVINVRGDIRSVLDLGRLLGVPAADAPGYVVLVRTGTAAAAFRIDQVEAVRAVELAAGAADPAAPFVRGVTADRLRVLDTAAVLAHPVFRTGPEKGSL